MLKRERISKLIGARVAAATPELRDQPYFREYFRLWNAQRYYDAHDVLEQLWLDPQYALHAQFLKGLIQAAGAFVHLQKNFDHPHHVKHSRRLKPAVRLFHLALANLPHESVAGFDVPAFRQMLTRVSGAVMRSEFTANPWTPQSAPQLREPS